MRDYKKEYRKFGSKPEVMAKKYERTKARRKAIKSGLVSRNDGSDLDHVNGIYNSKVMKTTQKKNRGKLGEGGRKKGVPHNYPKNRKSRKYVNGGKVDGERDFLKINKNFTDTSSRVDTNTGPDMASRKQLGEKRKILKQQEFDKKMDQQKKAQGTIDIPRREKQMKAMARTNPVGSLYVGAGAIGDKMRGEKKDKTMRSGGVARKRGLWDNIHAKRRRIASGSGEKMRRPGSKGAPTRKALIESKAEDGAVVYNKPKRTPGHPTKSHMVVVRKPGGGKKTIRFGQQGKRVGSEQGTAGKPKKGESRRMKMKRKSFKARHGKNIAKGKMSAAYWADKVKW